MQGWNKNNMSVNQIFLISQKKSHLNEKLPTLATKAKLKAEKDEIVKLETFDLSYFMVFVCLSTNIQFVIVKKRQRHWLCYWLEIKTFIWI